MNVYIISSTNDLSVDHSDHKHRFEKNLAVLASSIPNAIEVAEQYLAKGHDPITSVTLICEDVKQNKYLQPGEPYSSIGVVKSVVPDRSRAL